MEESIRREIEEDCKDCTTGAIALSYIFYRQYLSDPSERTSERSSYWKSFCEFVETNYSQEIRKPTAEEFERITYLRIQQSITLGEEDAMERKYRGAMGYYEGFDGAKDWTLRNCLDSDRRTRDNREYRERIDRETRRIADSLLIKDSTK